MDKKEPAAKPKRHGKPPRVEGEVKRGSKKKAVVEEVFEDSESEEEAEYEVGVSAWMSSV